MSHMPVDHPLRPLYRLLSLLAGVYLAVFGVLGAFSTGSGDFFARDHVAVLGLRTNLAFSLLSIVAGGVIVLAFFLGRNLDAAIFLWGGVAFQVGGMVLLALLQTDLNMLNATMGTCIVSFVIGVLLFAAGFYVRSSSGKQATQVRR